MCAAYRGFPVATDFLKQPPTGLNDWACGCVLSSPVSPQGPSPLNCFLPLLQFSTVWSPKFKPTSFLPLHLSPLCSASFPFTPVLSLSVSSSVYSVCWANGKTWEESSRPKNGQSAVQRPLTIPGELSLAPSQTLGLYLLPRVFIVERLVMAWRHCPLLEGAKR